MKDGDVRLVQQSMSDYYYAGSVGSSLRMGTSIFDTDTAAYAHIDSNVKLSSGTYLRQI